MKCPFIKYRNLCLKAKRSKAGCPKNTDGDCNIIPKKPKLARVKAKCDLDISGDAFAYSTYKFEKMRKYGIPCHIVFDRKHLKGMK